MPSLEIAIATISLLATLVPLIKSLREYQSRTGVIQIKFKDRLIEIPADKDINAVGISQLIDAIASDQARATESSKVDKKEAEKDGN